LASRTARPIPPVMAASYPGFEGLVRKSVEGKAAYDLRELRSKLYAYYEANKTCPPDLSAVASEIPELKLPASGHPPSGEVRVSTFADIRDTGGWLYVKAGAGSLYIDCVHPDARGKPWSSH